MHGDPPVDVRSSRTRRRLQQSVLQLLSEKGWDRTTVSEIVERASVGRSTFYSHFETKELLLQRSVLEAADLPTAVDDQSAEPVPSRGLLRHFEEHRGTARKVLSSSGRARVLGVIQRALVERAADVLARDPRRSNQVPVVVEAQYRVAALLGLATWWIESDSSLGADELDEMYRRLVG